MLTLLSFSPSTYLDTREDPLGRCAEGRSNGREPIRGSRGTTPTRTCTIRVSVCVVLGQQPLTQGSVHYTQGALNSLRLNQHSESGQQSR